MNRRKEASMRRVDAAHEKFRRHEIDAHAYVTIAAFETMMIGFMEDERAPAIEYILRELTTNERILIARDLRAFANLVDPVEAS